MPKRLLHRAKLAWREGDSETALALFEEGRRLHPDWLEEGGAPRFAREHLQHLLNSGRSEAAERLLVELSAGEPQPWLDAILLSDPRIEARELKAAAWARVADREPGNDAAQKQALVFALRSRDRERVAQISARLGGPDPSLPATFICDVAEAHLLTADLARADAWYAEAVRQQPASARVQFGLAALASDRGDYQASRGAFERATALAGPLDPRAQAALDYGREVWPLRARMVPRQPKLEIVIFSHVTAKLVHNADLAAPGTGLIQSTWDSLETVMQPKGARVTVMFDRRPGELDLAYQAALQAFCAQIGAELVVSDQNGLRRQWLAAARRATADLVFFVEHDWRFRPNCPTLDKVQAIFGRSPDMSYLRFNKHRNDKIRGHPVPFAGERPELGPVCRIPEFLNQPHLIRRSVLNDLVVRLIENDEARDDFNDRAGGVEETVNAALTRSEKAFGLPFTLRLFGAFLWGNLGAPKQILHLGY